MSKKVPQKSIVLYADDDRDDIELLQDSFEQFSRNVDFHSFENGVEMISFLNALAPGDLKPCLIILDINMPLLNGKETLTRIRSMKEMHSVPVILFSTSSLQADKTFATSLDAGFITKPLDSLQMDSVVKRFIDQCTDEVQQRIRIPAV